MKFQITSLVLIVPIGGFFLAGMFCICRHKWYIFKMDRETKPESTDVETPMDVAGLTTTTTTQKTVSSNRNREQEINVDAEADNILRHDVDSEAPESILMLEAGHHPRRGGTKAVMCAC
jgi:hypothetical protein